MPKPREAPSTAAVLCRFALAVSHTKAPEDWRTPQNGVSLLALKKKRAAARRPGADTQMPLVRFSRDLLQLNSEPDAYGKKLGTLAANE